MRLRFTRNATRDLTRLRDFIAGHDPGAAAKAGRRLGA
jgi:plasmid stabilization system protein ParE